MDNIPFYQTDFARRLHGPGPSAVSPNVLKAMSAQTIGHLDPKFMDLMNGLQGRLKGLYQADNAFALPVSGTGSAGMETPLRSPTILP